MEIKEALSVLTKAMKDDPEYAHSWYCNIACCVVDEKVDILKANRIAHRVMKLAFDIDTTKDVTSEAVSTQKTSVDQASSD